MDGLPSVFLFGFESLVTSSLCFYIWLKDDAPPRYADPAVRPSRARLDYEYGSSSHYGDPYGDRSPVFLKMQWLLDSIFSTTSISYIFLCRLGRSSIGYGSGRSSMSSQDSHGLYGSRGSMGYGGIYLSDLLASGLLITWPFHCLLLSSLVDFQVYCSQRILFCSSFLAWSYFITA